LSGSGISWASLQTDNHASTPPLSFYRPDALGFYIPTNSVKALKAGIIIIVIIIIWDVTIVSTLADSYLHSTSHSAGSAAETASVRKETKYSSLPSDFIFQPVAIETLGPLNAFAVNFK